MVGTSVEIDHRLGHPLLATSVTLTGVVNQATVVTVTAQPPQALPRSPLGSLLDRTAEGPLSRIHRQVPLHLLDMIVVMRMRLTLLQATARHQASGAHHHLEVTTSRTLVALRRPGMDRLHQARTLAAGIRLRAAATARLQATGLVAVEEPQATAARPAAIMAARPSRQAMAAVHLQGVVGMDTGLPVAALLATATARKARAANTVEVVSQVPNRIRLMMPVLLRPLLPHRRGVVVRPIMLGEVPRLLLRMHLTASTGPGTQSTGPPEVQHLGMLATTAMRTATSDGVSVSVTGVFGSHDDHGPPSLDCESVIRRHSVWPLGRCRLASSSSV